MHIPASSTGTTSAPVPASAQDGAGHCDPAAVAWLNQRPTEHPVCLGAPINLDFDHPDAGARLVTLMVLTLGLGMLACLAVIVAVAIGATPW